MSKTFGKIEWVDLTVENAQEVGEFYEQVVGWSREPVEVDGYRDFNMSSSITQEPVAGVCHKKGANKDIPSQWMLYVTVENLDDSLNTCKELEGTVIQEPRNLGEDRFAIIKDPAGAVMALFEKALVR